MSNYLDSRNIEFNENFRRMLLAYDDSNYDITVKPITFVVTQDCTLKCTYCYEKGKNCNNDMTVETGKKIIDMLYEEDIKNSKLINQKDAVAVVLDFIGGEPLLKIDLISDLCDYFVYKGAMLNHRWATYYMISICSNGTNYFDKKVQKFIERYKKRLSFAITIDGNKSLHDACRVYPNGAPSFDIVEKAYKDALSKGYTNTTKLTISPENLPFLSEALINLSNYNGVISIFANPIFEEEWSLENASLYYNELKKIGKYFIDNNLYKNIACSLFEEEYLGEKAMSNGEDQNYCGGTGAMLAFDAKGDIYPCLRCVPFALQNDRKPLKIGSLEDGIAKAPCHKCIIDELEAITLTSQSTEKCISCPIGQGCAWCSAWNYDHFGTMNKRHTGICNMHKARVMANSWYWNTIYKLENEDARLPLNIPKDWALEIISEEEYNDLLELTKS